MMKPGGAIVLNASFAAGKGNPLGSVHGASKAAVLFLASAEASYITGVDLLVDGGLGSF